MSKKHSWGIPLVLFSDTVSFYACFTTILAEIAFLWAFSIDNAMQFTFLLPCYIINVCIMGWLKGRNQGERKEVTCSWVFIGISLIIFVTGCFINLFLNVVLTIINALVTYLWDEAKYLKYDYYLESPNDRGYIKIVCKLTRIMKDETAYSLLVAFLFVVPFTAFVIFLAVTEVSTWIKILIPILYLLIIPLICKLEEISDFSVYGIATEITWNEEYEREIRLLEEEVRKESNEDEKK